MLDIKLGIGLTSIPILILFVLPVHAAIIHVPSDYSKIQWAVDNASIGDTIFVEDGTYVENLDVYKQLEIRSKNGSFNCIIKAANPDDHIFEIRADHVGITGFKIEGSTKAGIYLCGSYCSISNNIISDNYIGVHLSQSTSNNVTNNIIVSNDFGVVVFGSNNSDVVGNTINSSEYVGIYLLYSNDNGIVNNKISNAYVGILLSYFSNGNCIMDNDISENRNGIYLWHSSGNSIVNNTVELNTYGINLTSSSSNEIYFNNFNNTNNCYSVNSTNLWNSTVAISYAYEGERYVSYIGNYWSEYSCMDLNDDGICDDPYIIGENNTDYYPLVVYSSSYLVGSTLGDVNGDGSVDVLDLTYLVNVILGESSPTACSDVNGDGSIDVLDLTYLVNIILGT